MNYSNIFKIHSTSLKASIIFLLVLDILVTTSESSIFRNELKHVHVIFAHKLYAPLESDTKYGFPEQLDYRYFLENTYDMPNEAKLEIYNFGVYLRERYGAFLGEVYYSEILQMRTSEYFLSMISGLLVNAGLWPPAESQRWNDELDWQPIPSDYTPMESDRLFLGTLCPHFLDEEKRLFSTDESIKNKVSVHQPLFDHVSTNYGKKIERPSDITMLFSCFETIASSGENKTLPGWADDVFPYGEMANVTLLSYELLSQSPSQRQLNGGVFVKKIIKDSMDIARTNNTPENHGNHTHDFKISMYSGEERNVIGVLQALNLWWSPHLLANGASVIFELRHNQTADEYGFEIYYYSGVGDNLTIGLTLPGCRAFCPLDDFRRIVAEVLPDDEELLCHLKTPVHKKSSANSLQNYPRHIFPSLALLLFVVY